MHLLHTRPWQALPTAVEGPKRSTQRKVTVVPAAAVIIKDITLL